MDKRAKVGAIENGFLTTNKTMLRLLLLVVIAGVPAWSFKLGQEYTYSFVNEVNVSETTGSPISYKLEGDFNLATIWRNGDERLVQFRLISSKVFTLSQKTLEYVEQKSIPSISPKPFYAAFQGHSLDGVYLEPNECTKAKNLKRAVVSLFQYQSKDATTTEGDVTGTCDVSYIAWSPTQFTKSKLHCKLHDLLHHQRRHHPLGISEDVSIRLDYELGVDGVVQTIDSVEINRFKPNSYQNVEVVVNSTFDVEIRPAVGTLETLKCLKKEECLRLLTGVEDSELTSDVKERCEDGSCFNLVQQIKEAKEFLAASYIGKSDASGTLVSLVAAGREATTDEWIRVLKAKTTQEIRPQLLDLMAAAQTKEAFDAFRDLIGFNRTEDFHSQERYLQGLAIGVHPDDLVVLDLLKIAKDESFAPRLEDTLVQTLASMAHHMARSLDDDYDDLVVKSVLEFLEQKLTNCKEDECRLVYLRSLGNLRAPSTIPQLFGYVHEGSNRVSVGAMKALKAFSTSFWNTEFTQTHFERVFFQHRKAYDSSARTLALDILLQLKLKPPQITHLLKFLATNDSSFEVTQYLLQKLQINVASCSYWRKAVEKILYQNPKLNNYHILGQKGLSTAILRDFATFPSFNGSFLSVQEIKDGVLKRGTADIFVEANEEKFSIFTMGLFTNGLSSFVGGTDDPDATPTAGMELTVQGSTFRPLVFFNGQGELMGHVFSGTASEPTPAYQATTLLQDHKEQIRLQNGAHIELSVLGAVSVDLNGQIALSLWNRNAVSKVAQNFGFATVVKAEVESFVNLGLEFEVTEEPSLHMHSNIDFSDKIALCIQLSQPPNELRHFLTKSVQIPKSRSFKSSSTVARSFSVPGLTHVLNRKNNDMCNVILS